MWALILPVEPKVLRKKLAGWCVSRLDEAGYRLGMGVFEI